MPDQTPETDYLGSISDPKLVNLQNSENRNLKYAETILEFGAHIDFYL